MRRFIDGRRCAANTGGAQAHVGRVPKVAGAPTLH
jgi:hypothetical protein